MTENRVAYFLGVQKVRVERLERERRLLAKNKNDNGSPLFDSVELEKYKELTDRLGGISTAFVSF
ncbi:MAG: hypothetical protein ACI9DQ_000373 [Glaciecola sp.]|jgi:hypothetical protein